MIFLLKVLVSAFIIAFVSYLSSKKPILAGFLISIPLTSMIALAFSYLEHKDYEKTIIFAKSIFIGVPASLLFFIPFFFSRELNLGFLTTFLMGIVFLLIGYIIHKTVGNYF